MIRPEPFLAKLSRYSAMFLMALLRRASSDINLLSMISSSGAKLLIACASTADSVPMKSTEDFCDLVLGSLVGEPRLGKILSVEVFVTA